MIRFLVLLAIGLWFGPAAAAAPQPPKPLFATWSPMRIVIEAPLARLVANRSSEERVPGTLIDPAGNRLPISVAMRGLTRRTKEICDFPPLHIRFTAAPPSSSPFAGQGSKLKLVTHCRNSASGHTDLLLEYAAYRLFNRLSPKSFRARLALIDYRGAGGRAMVAPAFFIEDLDDVAARNGLTRLRAGPKIPTSDLSPPDAALYGLFQHMIANHDWSMRAGPVGKDCCHNAELIGSAGPGRSIPIPYDFDFSGFVAAPYAVPPDQLGLNSVKDRKYRGYCVHNEAVRQAARSIRAQWPALMAELDAADGLDPRARNGARAFLQGFYADIATDEAVELRILRRCVG